jgi:SAM-dependent methyltransferase
MMKMATKAAVLFLLGMLPAGCSRDKAELPLFTLSRENTEAATQRGLEPNAPLGQASPTTGRKSAVVFVAFVVTPQDVVERMLKIAAVTRRDVVYDLGCGDGRIIITAARKYGCRAVGYDLDPLRVQEARENARKNHIANRITVEEKDILKADVRDASVVTLYLGTELNARLIPQLRTLKPGSRIVSHDYGLDKIPPDKAVEMVSRADNRKHTLYLWTCPLPPAAD